MSTKERQQSPSRVVQVGGMKRLPLGNRSKVDSTRLEHTYNFSQRNSGVPKMLKNGIGEHSVKHLIPEWLAMGIHE